VTEEGMYISESFLQSAKANQSISTIPSEIVIFSVVLPLNASSPIEVRLTPSILDGIVSERDSPT
jgi:hypothetical protein